VDLASVRVPGDVDVLVVMNPRGSVVDRSPEGARLLVQTQFDLVLILLTEMISRATNRE